MKDNRNFLFIYILPQLQKLKRPEKIIKILRFGSLLQVSTLPWPTWILKMFKFINRNREFLVVGGGAFATLYGGSILLNSYLTNVQKFDPEGEDPEEANRQKVYLVTGANSGIGKALVKDLAQRNSNNKVYMLCRNMESCEEARSEIVKKSGNK